jgi:hypothetical protein
VGQRPGFQRLLHPVRHDPLLERLDVSVCGSTLTHHVQPGAACGQRLHRHLGGDAETGKSWRYEKTSNPLTATETASASLSGSGGVYSGSVDGSTPVSGHSIPSLNTSEIMAEGQQSQTNVLCPWLYSYFTSVNQNVNNFPTSFSATNYTKSRTTSTASMEINCPTC